MTIQVRGKVALLADLVLMSEGFREYVSLMDELLKRG